MKAITLTQPWATLVAVGAKKIETRSWSTSYRGPLAIHAGKGLAPVGGEPGLVDIVRSEPFRSVLLARIGEFGTWQLPRGCIIAVCELVDCHRTTIRNGRACYCTQASPRVGMNTYEFVSDNEAAFGDYSSGRFGWLLTNVRALPEPIPARGALGLWNWAPPEGASL